jgi:hypothetical protein
MKCKLWKWEYTSSEYDEVMEPSVTDVEVKYLQIASLEAKLLKKMLLSVTQIAC